MFGWAAICSIYFIRLGLNFFGDKFFIQRGNGVATVDHFEGVVLDYLRADRGLFVNSQCCIQLNEGANPDTSGPHWYCDAVAVSFKEQMAYLCEITYAAGASSLLGRLRSWDEHWEGLKVALARDSGVPAAWRLRPWLFVPEAHAERLKAGLASLRSLPSPRITFLEEVVPWRYRSWNRGSYEDAPGL